MVFGFFLGNEVRVLGVGIDNGIGIYKKFEKNDVNFFACFVICRKGYFFNYDDV